MGQSSPRIRKRELLPQPFGPEIIKCMPGRISKLISGRRMSPLGDRIGTFSKTILSLKIISPCLAVVISMLA